MDEKHRSKRARLYHVLRYGSRQIDPSRSPLMTNTLHMSSIHLGRVWHHLIPDPAVSQGGAMPYWLFTPTDHAVRPIRISSFREQADLELA